MIAGKNPRTTNRDHKIARFFAFHAAAVYAPLLGILAGAAVSVEAAVTYTPGSTPTVTLSSVINNVHQTHLGTAFSAVNQSTIPVNITATGLVHSTTDNNALYSTVLANTSTLTTDISTVSGSAAGSSLASVNTQENTGITAYSQVNNSSVTSTITNPGAASSVSLSGNSISAETDLNKTVQKGEGTIGLTFDSSHPGTATLASASPVLTGDAGLFAGSSQINSGATDGASTTGFATISGTNQIALTTSGTMGNGLSLKVDDNSISAAFTGNNTENLLTVESGGATALTSSAGIANLQINDTVDSGSGSSATVGAGSSISASVQTNPLTSTSLSFDGNQLKASATGSVADNELQVASSLNVDADGAQANALDFTAASETSTTSGGLFVNNVQLANDSPVIATATDPAAAAAALSVDSRGLINSALTADGNSFEAIALGNDAASSISVDGATSFTGAVAAANLQAVDASPVSAVADSGTLAVNLGGSPALVDVPENDITGSTISLSGNTVSALAVANRDPLLVNITGTIVTDGLTQTAGTSVNNGTQTLASTAGFSAISSQAAAGSNVTASNTGAGINLAAAGFPIATGAAGPHVSDSTFTQSGNSLTSLANLNEGLVAVGIDANQLNGASAVASVQNATTSNVTATTSGTIIAGVNTRNAGAVTSTNIAILVGDGDPGDGVYEGNTISATAGGNLNAAALEAMASTAIQVADVIDMDGASSNSLGLSSDPAAVNRTLAEMAVLTDQRLDVNTISATTDFSRVAGYMRVSGDPVSNTTLDVDGNQVTATARGNLTSNSLDFSALAVDMSLAEVGGAAAGSNLASMGAVQVMGGQSSVTATVNAGADAGTTNSEIQGFQAGGGDLTNFGLSVDNNYVAAAATGNTATSSLNGSGGSLAQDVPGVLAGTLNIAALPTTALTVVDTAVANAVLQSNGGTVAANLATTDNYQITARTQANNTITTNSKDITTSVISADNNRAVALATGSSGEVSTELAFTTLESSAATAVQQAQSGSTTATVGGAGAVTISAWTPINTNLHDSTISASGNTAGAQAVGADASTSLNAEGTVTLASGFADTAVDGASATIYATGATTASADFMLGVQQNVSGATSATADDLSVLVSGGRFAGGALTADDNFLTAQASGGNSAADLALTGSGMLAGGNPENTADAVLSSDQRLSAAVAATLTASDVRADAVNLTTDASGANGAEAVSVNGNTLMAAGTGLGSINTLTTDATTSIAGDSSGVRTADNSGDVAGVGWDRLLVSNQNVGATGTVTVTASTNSVSAAVTGSLTDPAIGNVEGDALTVDNNDLLAQGTGASSSNSLSTTAGASVASLSQAIVAQQTSAGAVAVSNSTVAATLDIGTIATPADSIDSGLSISGNQLAATATGLSGDNDMSLNSATAITDDTGLDTFTAVIMSGQDLADTAVVGATLTDSRANLLVTGEIDESSLRVDDNSLLAQGIGARSSNTLATSAGTDLDSVSQAIAVLQDSAAAVTATNANASAALTVGDIAAPEDSFNSSLSVSGNQMAATATGLSGVNSLAMDATVSIIDDATLVPSGILSEQYLADTAAVTAGLSNAQASVDVTNSVYTSTLQVDNNSMLAQGTGASNSNSLTSTAGTSITDVFQGIIAVQDSAASVDVSNSSAAATLNIGSVSEESSLSVSGNQLAALATGLKNTNSASLASDVAIIDSGDMPPNGIAAMQDLADTATVTADLADSAVDLFVFEDSNVSSLKVDNNVLEANAKGATSSNVLNASSTMIGTDFFNGVRFAAGAQQTSAAAVSAFTTDASINLTIDDGQAWGSNLSLTGNSISAIAGNLTGANTLSVKAEAANYGDDGALNYDDTAGITANSDRMILSSQDVADTGDVTAIADSAGMELYVWDELEGNSTAQMNNNTVASSATVASNSNALTNNAATFLGASSLIADTQTSAADATAQTSNSNLDLYISYPVWDSSVSLSDNQLTASATGLSATNSLDVNGGSMQGRNPFGIIISSSSGHSIGGFSAISSEQTTSGAIAATLDDSGIFFQTSDDGEITNASADIDNNLVQASSTAASASNTIMQLTDTSMSDAPAMLAATQNISGSSTATVTGAWVGAYGDNYVDAANISVDGNTIQAVANGGTMENFIDPASGTSLEFFGGADPNVDAANSTFIGTYGLVSRQISTADVSAIHDGNSDITLEINGDSTGNSALSVSDNILRSQATNLSADNTVVTAAKTALNGVVSGVLSYQDVSGATSAITSGADVWVYGNNINGAELDGAANVDNNWEVAVATGGSVTNELSGSGLSVSGWGVGIGSSLTTSAAIPEAVSGFDSSASLLNLQSRTGEVTAEMNSIDGDLEISATFDNVTGSVSVSDNLMAAEARGLVAENSLSLTSQTVINGGSLALGSVQTGAAAVTATLNDGSEDAIVNLTAAAPNGTETITGTASMDGNTALASATSNLAINSLTATAGTQMLNLGSETTTTITDTDPSINSETVGFALQNVQTGTIAAPVTASVDSLYIESDLSPLNGTASVDNNTVLAQARGQAAQNSLVLNGGTDLQASASLANAQTNGGAINSTITTGNIGLNATGITGTTSINGNTVQASATANLAFNSMAISGTLAASSGGSTNTLGTLNATADYVALNYQDNTAAVTSTVTDYSIGHGDSGLASTGTTSVMNNLILADATGNSATNTFTISATGGSSTADFAFNGYQANSGAISSTISGASINLASAGGTGTFRASGNRIGASAIGNSSISSIAGVN